MERMTDAISRRQFLKRTVGLAGLIAATPAATSLLAACGPAAPQTKDVAVRFSWLLSNQFAGDVVAAEKGYFAEEKLNVDLRPGGPNLDGINLVASGAEQIGNISSMGSIIAARSRGIPLKALAAIAQRHPAVYVTLKPTEIKSAQDFIGKKIGVSQIGRWQIEAIIAANKLPADKIQIVPVSSEPTALLLGQVDAFYGWSTTLPYAVQKAGKEYNIVYAEELGIRGLGQAIVYFTTDAVLQKDPELVERYLRAVLKGWALARERPEEATDLLLKRSPNLDRGAEMNLLKVLHPLMQSELTRSQGLGAIDRRITEEMMKNLLQYKQIDRAVSMDEVLADEPFKKASSVKI